MIDKDHVFARFQDNAPAADRERELLTIPRRRGAVGSRVVEVVHVRAGAAGKDRPHRADPQVRAASWEDGFPTRKGPTAPAETARPHLTAHVMPMWEAPAVGVAAPEPQEDVPAEAAAAPVRKPRPSGRRVADPFDASDDGANCIRCGYRIEAARERHGAMTCAACG